MDKDLEMCASIHEDFPHINGVQIYHDKDLMFETYNNGVTRETLNPTGCIFKSFISAAVGVALRDGLIHSVKQRLVEFFPDLITGNPNMERITIAHALTKTTGIAWPPPGADMAIDTMQAAFSLEMKSMPGEVFEYKPDPQLLVYLLEEISGIPFDSYVKKAVFDPLGIQSYHWDTTYGDIQGMKMPMHEVAKLGQLYMANGRWNGVQILQQSFVAESLKPHVDRGFPEQAGYGYLWWIGSIEANPIFFAGGFGGQYLIAVPDKEIVVVIASQMDRPHPENKIIVRNLLRDES